jgi:L-threonylcarbamoyladenylate synthase
MADVERAVAALRAGEPVLLPTDTVYGLCVTPEREEAIAEVHRLKGRPAEMPTALLCAGLDTLLDEVPELEGRSVAYARVLLPGPYTLVLPNPARRFPRLSGGAPGTIGVRVPVLQGPSRAVIRQVGAVAATSANRHGETDPSKLEDVPGEIREACAAEIDGGELPGTPSTVIDLTGPEPRVLREGAVPATQALARLATVRP